MKDNRIWREAKRAMLAGLLCLPLCTVTAEPVTTMTGGEMETTDPVPEGYSPLSVTEFVVDAEKNDTYILSFGVKDDAIMQDDWILTKYIRGHLSVYNPVNKQLLYTVSIPKEKKIPVVFFRFPYNKVNYQGVYYYLELKKGRYLIHPELFILNSKIKEPDILLSFRRKKFVW
ncbi:TPA: hypothetical protein R0445_004667 [Salmonella enterica subsp. enterica serovar Hvittingfoss]|nr:hypothetical protein [Salmonella enterica subsp. enterica serovar Hvittingfoss]